ncbi:hypothetical protein HUK83_15860 [Endobacter medicaginis]|uniref:Uncharacterized protein n=1 Tax=Endobacter medicaginis TaxID=1181271 RepID=A0A850NSD7_9PROT|nr:hypothetical protein [Endobacter medicaginis]
MTSTLHLLTWAFGGGTGIAIAGAILWLAKQGAEKIVEHFLDKRLEDFKSEHTREIERLRSDLHHLEDRGVRSNEREYEALVSG